MTSAPIWLSQFRRAGADAGSHAGHQDRFTKKHERHLSQEIRTQASSFFPLDFMRTGQFQPIADGQKLKIETALDFAPKAARQVERENHGGGAEADQVPDA